MKKILFVTATLLIFHLSKAQKHETVKIITSLSELHSNCFNVIDIYVAGVQEIHEYTYEVDGGITKPGNKNNQLLISPIGSVVTIEVFDGTGLLGSANLTVSEHPRPSIVVYEDGKKMELFQKTTRHLHELKLTAEYGEGVRKCINGQFKVTEWNAVLLKYNKAMVVRRYSNSETMNIADWRKELKHGDRILIEVRKIVQLMPSGEEKDIKIKPQIISLTLE